MPLPQKFKKLFQNIIDQQPNVPNLNFLSNKGNTSVQSKKHSQKE